MNNHSNQLISYPDRLSSYLFSKFILLAFICCISSSRLMAAEVVVVAFGDSTTAPRGKLKVYADLLEDKFQKFNLEAKIINAGVGGNTTKLAMTRFESDVLAKKPDIVIIQFGINDAAVDVWKTPPETTSRVSLKAYETNIRKFIRQLKNRGSQVVLMTPNSLRWTPKLIKFYGKPPYLPGDKNGFNVLLVQYAESVRRIGKEESVPVIDVYSAFEKYGNVRGQSVDDLLLDGMHPDKKGQQIVFELLIKSPPFKSLLLSPVSR